MHGCAALDTRRHRAERDLPQRRSGARLTGRPILRRIGVAPRAAIQLVVAPLELAQHGDHSDSARNALPQRARPRRVVGAAAL
eukprot:7040556-Prymnesium_polylepis.1